MRTGAKKQPKYRIVIASKQEKRDGRYIEIIGQYDPNVDPAKVVVNTQRYRYWLGVGAQPTKTVFDLVKRYERSG